MAKDTPAPRSRTQVRIVNLKGLPPAENGNRRWEELPAEYKSSADAIKGHGILGEGGFQPAHLFGEPKRYKLVQPPPMLIPDTGEIDDPPATEADDDTGAEE